LRKAWPDSCNDFPEYKESHGITDNSFYIYIYLYNIYIIIIIENVRSIDFTTLSRPTSVLTPLLQLSTYCFYYRISLTAVFWVDFGIAAVDNADMQMIIDRIDRGGIG